MGKLTPKYEPTLTFSIEKDGFYGYYYEPVENKFPGKSMVIFAAQPLRLPAESYDKQHVPGGAPPGEGVQRQP